MIELSKHFFEPLRRDEDSILYRGRGEEDSSQVLVLTPANEDPHSLIDLPFMTDPEMRVLAALIGPSDVIKRMRAQKMTGTRFGSGMGAVAAGDVNERGQSFVLIAVRDSELGLDAAQLEYVFETFYTTKSFGMGMGLAISRSIIEAHHGWLWGSSNTPRGAVFQFTLPCQAGL